MNKYFTLLFSLLVFGCDDPNQIEIDSGIVKRDTIVLKQAVLNDTVQTVTIPISNLEQKLIDHNLVNVQELDSTIQIDLRYATTNNFLSEVLYDSLDACYLLPEVANKLKLAQQILKSKYPYYSLKVFDGVRPRSVQQKMWDLLDKPLKEKPKYVSNPKNGSLHNFGAAVDLTIVNEKGEQLDMGTPYDYFGELAYPRLEQKHLESGALTKEQYLNRLLLREVMQNAGFMPITTEWWHFNSCYRKEAWANYTIVE